MSRSLFFPSVPYLYAVAVFSKIGDGAFEQPAGGLDQLVGEYGLGRELLGEYVLVDVRRQRPDWVLLNAYNLKQTTTQTILLVSAAREI